MTVYYVGRTANVYHDERACRIIDDRPDSDIRTQDSPEDLWRDIRPCRECVTDYEQENKNATEIFRRLTDDDTTSLDALRGGDA
jgi:hypothetical protein